MSQARHKAVILDDLKRAERRPFLVDAVQVTEANMAKVAQWCKGEVRTNNGPDGSTPAPYIKVFVLRPMDDKQTMAFVGDWVLYAGTGFKVYTNRAFHNSFEIKEN